MATSPSSPKPLTPPPHQAPWLPTFSSHLSKLPSPEFVLSTLSHPDDGGNAEPRARYCIFRGFWANDMDLHPSALEQLREEGKEKDGYSKRLNPPIYESDMLTFTTDVRMEKVGQLGAGSKDGDGGPVEAVFWIKDVMSQWRIRGRAFVLGGGVADGEEKENVERDRVRKWMRRKEEDRESDGGGGESGRASEWTWEREVTAHFANLSPIMRGSFKNPPPGTPKTTTPSDPSLRLGQKVTDLHDPDARKNFRVVIIQPEEVERVDLSSPEEAQRWRWTLTTCSDNEKGTEEDGGIGRWDMVELWP